MGILDGPLRAASKDLITRFGREVTFRRKTAGAYDPDSRKAALTPADTTVRALFGQYRARFGRTDREGGARSTDLMLVVAAAAIGTPEPTSKDCFVFGGKEHEIVELDEAWSGDEIALYSFRVRR